MNNYPNGPQQPYQQPPSGYPQPHQQIVKKKSKVVWVVLGIIGALVLCGVIANAEKRDTNTQSGTTDQLQQATPTVAPKPTLSPKPASRATIDQIEKDLVAPEDPIVESYNEQTGELKVAQQFGSAITLTSEIIKNIVHDHMAGYFDTHKDTNLSSVTVTIYQYSQSSSSYIVMAHATMSRSSAQKVGWFFVTAPTIWNDCSNTWIDPSIV